VRHLFIIITREAFVQTAMFLPATPEQPEQWFFHVVCGALFDLEDPLGHSNCQTESQSIGTSGHPPIGFNNQVSSDVETSFDFDAKTVSRIRISCGPFLDP